MRAGRVPRRVRVELVAAHASTRAQPVVIVRETDPTHGGLSEAELQLEVEEVVAAEEAKRRSSEAEAGERSSEQESSHAAALRWLLECVRHSRRPNAPDVLYDESDRRVTVLEWHRQCAGAPPNPRPHPPLLALPSRPHARPVRPCQPSVPERRE